MRKIISLLATDNYLLLVKFDNGVEKQFDMKPYLELPVFTILKDKQIFQDVTNQKYFVEWKEKEIDLSADTLWHEGK